MTWRDEAVIEMDMRKRGLHQPKKTMAEDSEDNSWGARLMNSFANILS